MLRYCSIFSSLRSHTLEGTQNWVRVSSTLVLFHIFLGALYWCQVKNCNKRIFFHPMRQLNQYKELWKNSSSDCAVDASSNRACGENSRHCKHIHTCACSGAAMVCASLQTLEWVSEWVSACVCVGIFTQAFLHTHTYARARTHKCGLACGVSWRFLHPIYSAGFAEWQK